MRGIRRYSFGGCGAPSLRRRSNGCSFLPPCDCTHRDDNQNIGLVVTSHRYMSSAKKSVYRSTKIKKNGMKRKSGVRKQTVASSLLSGASRKQEKATKHSDLGLKIQSSRPRKRVSTTANASGTEAQCSRLSRSKVSLKMKRHSRRAEQATSPGLNAMIQSIITHTQNHSVVYKQSMRNTWQNETKSYRRSLDLNSSPHDSLQNTDDTSSLHNSCPQPVDAGDQNEDSIQQVLRQIAVNYNAGDKLNATLAPEQVLLAISLWFKELAWRQQQRQQRKPEDLCCDELTSHDRRPKYDVQQDPAAGTNASFVGKNRDNEDAGDYVNALSFLLDNVFPALIALCVHRVEEEADGANTVAGIVPEMVEILMQNSLNSQKPKRTKKQIQFGDGSQHIALRVDRQYNTLLASIVLLYTKTLLQFEAMVKNNNQPLRSSCHDSQQLEPKAPIRQKPVETDPSSSIPIAHEIRSTPDTQKTLVIANSNGVTPAVLPFGRRNLAALDLIVLLTDAVVSYGQYGFNFNSREEDGPLVKEKGFNVQDGIEVANAFAALGVEVEQKCKKLARTNQNDSLQRDEFPLWRQIFDWATGFSSRSLHHPYHFHKDVNQQQEPQMLFENDKVVRNIVLNRLHNDFTSRQASQLAFAFFKAESPWFKPLRELMIAAGRGPQT